MQKDDHILDEPEQLLVKQWYDHWSIVYGPIFLIIIGVSMNVLDWPFARLVIASGLLMAAIRSSIYFFVKPRAIVDWIYFSLKIALTTILIFQFLFGRVGIEIVGLVVMLYLLAVFLKLLKSHRKNEPDSDKIEEDY